MDETDLGTFAWPLLDGMWQTLLVFIGGIAIATVVGVLVGAARLSRLRVVRGAAMVFVEFFRGTSALVQLYWVFYAMPVLFNVSVPAVVAGWIVIGCNQGAYFAEVVRGSVRAIPKAQVEVADALNFDALTKLRLIIVPQALPVVLPSYTNIMVSALKETAIVSLVGVMDLTFTANTLRTEYAHTTELFVSIAVVYLVLNLGLARVGRLLEHRVDVRVKSAKRRARQPEMAG